jgi:2-methoxy-6-polyprenyl-1,4-benzoquinol methylase
MMTIMLFKRLFHINLSTASFLNAKQTHTKVKLRDIEEREEICKLFDNAACNYDKLCNVALYGNHQYWRRKLIHYLAPSENTKLIDAAGGTGAIAFRFLDYVNRNNIAKNCHVTICDMNETMMEIAKREAVKYDPNLISFVKGNVEDLPFENASFNAYTMCFGMRYVRNIDKVFDEAYRVLQPGGKFLNLEFSHVEDGIVKWLYNQYTKYIIPLSGRLCNQIPLQKYLVESIQRFPNQESLKTKMKEAGFQQVTYVNLQSGIVAIHMGIKP